jgi:hypothetical protein
MIVKLEFDTIVRIKTILEQFGTLSGLLCNVDKTTLLPIGENIQVDNRIWDLGFIIAEKVTILGLELDKNGATDLNFSRVVEKIRSIIANWVPYNLSLPGRINIAKSLMYSQMNYLGCFLPFPVEHISAIDSIITTFVKGKINIAKKKTVSQSKTWRFGPI